MKSFKISEEKLIGQKGKIIPSSYLELTPLSKKLIEQLDTKISKNITFLNTSLIFN